ncbi:MAG: exosortase A [Aromatoleum sp.]|nr:exosortase A [Aromatoleum sp.]
MNAPVGHDVGLMRLEAPERATWNSAPVLAAALAVLGILAVYWRTAESIVAIWIRSETFTHGFVVIPMCLWLVWRQRAELAAISVRPWWPGLAIVLGAGALWFTMSVADVLGVKQFALAFMVQAAIVTVVGLRVTRALAFPLVFLLFAVPFGEIFVPTLIEWTADFTIAALRASGVPVYREANHFIIPSGAWSVVEACSGVRYIIASVMVGTIYAAIAYRSTRRRVLFLGASVLVPIVANWLRAYMIVMLGHLSNNKLAVGVDHLIYGWIFFGVVMALLFWVGSFWNEDATTIATPAAALASRAAVTDRAGVPRPMLFVAAIAAIAAAGLWQPVSALVDRQDVAGTPVVTAVAAGDGWAASTSPITSWKPHYRGYAAEREQRFRRGDDAVGLYVAYYLRQEKGLELVTSGNLLVTPQDFTWKLVSRGSAEIEWAGHAVTADTGELSGPATRLDVLRLYWVDGRVTGSEYVAKALLAWSKLAGHGDDSALIVVYAPKRLQDDASRDTLRAFVAAHSPAIERALADARRSAR